MKHSIKIGFFIDQIASPTGGTEKQLLLLLEKMDRTRFEPHLFVLRASQWLRDCFRLCPVHVLGISSFRNPHAFVKIGLLSSFLKVKGFQVVHTFFRDSTIVGVLASRLSGSPKVVSSRRNQGYWYTGLEISILRFLNRFVDVVAANCESTRQVVSRLEGLGPGRIQVIYNGIDDTFLERLKEAGRESCRRSLGIPSQARVVGVVANLRPQKGLDVFLEAARIVHERVPEAVFVIAGEGSERSRLEKKVAELGLNGPVRFLGRVEDVAPVLKALDVGVLSSHTESFPNAVLEYMAASLPVVCTDVGGLREAVEHGRSGYLVPPGRPESLAEAVSRILLDGKSKAMGELGLARIRERFGVRQMVLAHERLYLELAGKASTVT